MEGNTGGGDEKWIKDSNRKPQCKTVVQTEVKCKTALILDVGSGRGWDEWSASSPSHFTHGKEPLQTAFEM